MGRDDETTREGADIGETPELHITPLVDVVFLLLVFFIVTSEPPNVEQTLDLNLIQAAAPAEVKPGGGERLLINVDVDCRIILGEERIGLDAFARRLRRKLRDGPVAVAVQASPKASTACVVDVLDTCAQAGVTDFGLVRQP